MFHTMQNKLYLQRLYGGVGKTLCDVPVFTVCTGLCAHVPCAPTHSELSSSM